MTQAFFSSVKNGFQSMVQDAGVTPLLTALVTGILMLIALVIAGVDMNSYAYGVTFLLVVLSAVGSAIALLLRDVVDLVYYELFRVGDIFPEYPDEDDL